MRKKGLQRKRLGIPNRVIEGFAKRDLRYLDFIHESGFYKAPRGNLRYAAEFRGGDYLLLKLPKKGEKLLLHTHPNKAATANCALPTFNDLKNLLTMHERHKINTFVISRVNEKGEEIGRTFIKLRIKDEKKLDELIQYMENFERSLNDLEFEEFERVLELKAGKLFRKWRENKLLSVKFVPMSGYRFDEKLGDFVREEKELNSKH